MAGPRAEKYDQTSSSISSVRRRGSSLSTWHNITIRGHSGHCVAGQSI